MCFCDFAIAPIFLSCNKTLKRLFTDTVPVNKMHLTETVPVIKIKIKMRLKWKVGVLSEKGENMDIAIH